MAPFLRQFGNSMDQEWEMAFKSLFLPDEIYFQNYCEWKQKVSQIDEILTLVGDRASSVLVDHVDKFDYSLPDEYHSGRLIEIDIIGKRILSRDIFLMIQSTLKTPPLGYVVAFYPFCSKVHSYVLYEILISSFDAICKIGPILRGIPCYEHSEWVNFLCEI